MAHVTWVDPGWWFLDGIRRLYGFHLHANSTKWHLKNLQEQARNCYRDHPNFEPGKLKIYALLELPLPSLIMIHYDGC